MLKITTMSKSKHWGTLKFKDVIPKAIGKFNYIYNVGTKFYFHTNHRASNYKVVMIDIHENYDPAKISKSPFISVIPEHPQNVLTSVNIFGGKLIC